MENPDYGRTRAWTRAKLVTNNANAAAKRKPEWDGEEIPDDLFDLESFVFWMCSTNHFVTQK